MSIRRRCSTVSLIRIPPPEIVELGVSSVAALLERVIVSGAIGLDAEVVAALDDARRSPCEETRSRSPGERRRRWCRRTCAGPACRRTRLLAVPVAARRSVIEPRARARRSPDRTRSSAVLDVRRQRRRRRAADRHVAGQARGSGQKRLRRGRRGPAGAAPSRAQRRTAGGRGAIASSTGRARAGRLVGVREREMREAERSAARRRSSSPAGALSVAGQREVDLVGAERLELARRARPRRRIGRARPRACRSG